MLEPIVDVVAVSPGCADDVVKAALVEAEPAAGREILLLASSALPELDARLDAGARLGSVVHLGRIDVTAQAIRWSYDDQPATGGRYDAADVNHRLGVLLADRARWATWWARRSVAPVAVTFEALRADAGAAAGQLASAFALPGPVRLPDGLADPPLVERWLAHHCRFGTRTAHGPRREVIDLTVGASRYELEVDPDDFVGREIILTGRPYEADLLETVARHMPSGRARILDVGAHIGNHTVALAALGHDVVALEPNPAARRLLESNVRRNGLDDRVTVHGVAAGTANGTGTLVVDVDNSGAARLEIGDGPIPVRRIDDLVTDVDLVKLDVEGRELDAIQGAHRLLSTCRPAILAEAHDDAAFDAIAGALALYGYRSDGVSLAADPTYLFTAG